MINKEVETKIEVMEYDFYRLLEACRLLESVNQINVYYDCMQRLACRAATFRVRHQDNSLPKMTLKIPINSEDGRRTCLEIEEALSSWVEPASFLLVESDLPLLFRPHLYDLGISRLDCLGEMRTQRTVARLPQGIVVELDKVTLPNGNDFFEVEIESDDLSLHALALAEIKDMVQSYTLSEISKFQRFLSTITS